MKRTIETIVGTMLVARSLIIPAVVLMIVLDTSLTRKILSYGWVLLSAFIIWVIFAVIFPSIFLYIHAKKNPQINEKEKSWYLSRSRNFDFDFLFMTKFYPRIVRLRYQMRYYYNYIWKEQKGDNSRTYSNCPTD